MKFKARIVLLDTENTKKYIFFNEVNVGALHDAIKKGDIAKIRTLIQSHVDVNAANTEINNSAEQGITTVELAISDSNLEIIKLLIEEGKADLTAKNYVELAKQIAEHREKILLESEPPLKKRRLEKNEQSALSDWKNQNLVTYIQANKIFPLALDAAFFSASKNGVK